jgi:hypothetical protein
MRKPRRIEIVVSCVILALLFALAAAGFVRHRRSGMGPTSCQFSHIGLALKQYSMDYDERYPWIEGSSLPPWTFLGMIFPAYCSDPDVFIYEGCRDSDYRALSLDPERPCSPLAETDLISFSYGIDGRDPHHPTSWTENAPSTVRLLADKKAGTPLPAGKEGRRISHWGNGRKVLYQDGHYKWERLKAAVDPDLSDDAVGAPGAVEYSAYWSDPLYWFEWRNRHREERP